MPDQQRLMQKAYCKKLICQCAMINGESVMLQELLLTVHTLHIERKPLRSFLSIESLSGSEEGSAVQQMMPELLSKAFSAKAK